MIHAIVLPVRLVAAAFLFAMAMAKICSWPRVTEDLWRPAGLPLRLFAPGVLAVAALEAGYAVLTGAGLLRGSALILAIINLTTHRSWLNIEAWERDRTRYRKQSSASPARTTAARIW